MDDQFLYAVLLTLLAGLSTGIGSLIAFFSRTTNRTFLSFALGLSAGVMIYVSFVDIIPKAFDAISRDAASVKLSQVITAASFIGGMLLIALIDRLVPSVENPHEMRSVESMELAPEHKHKLMRMGVMTALVIAIHNFPEGIVTFMATLEDPNIGAAIAGAIAIHNIPEGDSRRDSSLLRHLFAQKGLQVVATEWAVRACGCVGGLRYFAAIPFAHGDRHSFWSVGRSDGLHLARRTAARRTRMG